MFQESDAMGLGVLQEWGEEVQARLGCEANQWHTQLWFSQVLDSPDNKTAAQQFRKAHNASEAAVESADSGDQERSMGPGAYVYWYLRMLRNALAHADLSDNVYSADMTELGPADVALLQLMPFASSPAQLVAKMYDELAEFSPPEFQSDSPTASLKPAASLNGQPRDRRLTVRVSGSFQAASSLRSAFPSGRKHQPSCHLARRPSMQLVKQPLPIHLAPGKLMARL